MDFPHEVRFSAGIGPAHFLADLRNAALSAFEEGAPFMGTALAAYRQCIGAEVVCISPLVYLFIYLFYQRKYTYSVFCSEKAKFVTITS